ncbi:hypothetical protein BKA80DRAFT_274330 [Phyllosticta citrichinensis]
MRSSSASCLPPTPPTIRSMDSSLANGSTTSPRRTMPWTTKTLATMIWQTKMWQSRRRMRTETWMPTATISWTISSRRLKLATAQMQRPSTTTLTTYSVTGLRRLRRRKPRN